MTMADYIDRDEAIAALNKVRDDQRVFKYATASDFLSARDAIERAVKVLESLPAADVEPVKRGSWGKVYKSKVTVTDGYVSSCCDMWNERRTRYCPNCGCRMDEEETHER